jgi:predicted transcriptional regulator
MSIQMKIEKQFDFKDPREFALKSYLFLRSLAKEVQEQDKPYILNAMKRIQAFSYNPLLVSRAVNDVRLRLERQRSKLLSSTNYFSLPDPKILTGDIYVGNTVGSNLPVYIPLRRINENIGIWGRLGSGKTNLSIILCLGLYLLGIPVRIYDYKDEYRNLLNYIEDMVVLNRRYDKLNPLEAMDEPRAHLQFLGDTLQQDFNLRPETKFMLINYMDELYKRYGIYEGSKVYPSIYNLKELLLEEANNSKMSSSKKRKIYTCIELFDFLINSLGDMLDCSSGFSETKLLNCKIVSHELSGISSNIQSWVTKLKVKNLHRTCFLDKERNKLKKVGVFEEAKMSFADSLHQSSTSIDYIKQLFTQGRSSGFGSIVTDQNKNQLADFVVNNLSCQFCFSLSSPQEIRPMAFSLGCTDEQVKQFHFLKIPYSVMSPIGHPPFLIRIPRIPMGEQLSDERLIEKMKPRLENLGPTTTPKPERLKMKVELALMRQPKTRNLADLLKEMKGFLEQVKNDSKLNISQLYAALKLSGRRGDKLKQQLMGNNLIAESVIRTGEKKRPAKKLTITPKGERMIQWLEKKVKEA